MLIKKSVIIYCLFSIILLTSGCNKYKEPVPFFDGLFLEYDAGLKLIFNCHVIDNNEFKIIETTVRSALGNKVIDIFVDAYGKVYKSTFKDYEGKYSFIWIPVHQMKIGDTFNEGYKVLRKDKWKQWEVLVVKNPYFNEERYFELNTGYLVGAKGSIEVNLVKTNADIPTVE